MNLVMRKSFGMALSLCALAVSGAQAQSSVTIGGLLDEGIAVYGNSNGKRLVQM